MSELNNGHKRGLYRTRDGVFLGVCGGLADYFNIRVGWLRFFVVITALLTKVAPMVALYLLAALLMRREEGPRGRENARRRSPCRGRSFHGMADRLRRRFERMESRLRRMEDTVTSREFEWDRKMRT